MHGFGLAFQNFKGGEQRLIARIERGIGNWMTVSPDGRSVLFCTTDLRSGDLMLVDGFR